MIPINMLMKFKLICVNRKAVEGDESFCLRQFILLHRKVKAIPALSVSCPALTSRMLVALEIKCEE